jgi:hypothetical protein
MLVNKCDTFLINDGEISTNARKKNGIIFSHRPYIPFAMEDDYQIYINRLAPQKTGVTVCWQGEGEEFVVTLLNAKREQVRSIPVKGKTLTIEGLDEQTEYALTVLGKTATSRERLFVTGDYKGEVINYLHPKDLQYAYSGRYLASPSIVRYKGDLYVLMDVFRGSDQSGAFNLSLLYRSKDDGKNWQYVCELVPCFWGTLFTAGDKLCVLACASECGSLIVSVSEDGENFSTPTCLLYGAGERSQGGPHRAPTPYCEYNGRLYFSVELGGHCIKRFDSCVLSLDLSKNPLYYDSWTFSKPRMVEFEWGGDSNVRFAIEGNMVERNGKIYNLLRFAAGKALMLEYDVQNLHEAPKFYKVVDLPLGHCKFFIQRGKDGTYYAMGNHACYPRQRLQLYKSKDLENWDLVKTLEDIMGRDAEKEGVQYPSFVLEGNTLYTVLRIALNGANTFHDSNAISFRTFTTDEE